MFLWVTPSHGYSTPVRRVRNVSRGRRPGHSPAGSGSRRSCPGCLERTRERSSRRLGRAVGCCEGPKALQAVAGSCGLLDGRGGGRVAGGVERPGAGGGGGLRRRVGRGRRPSRAGPGGVEGGSDPRRCGTPGRRRPTASAAVGDPARSAAGLGCGGPPWQAGPRSRRRRGRGLPATLIKDVV